MSLQRSDRLFGGQRPDPRTPFQLDRDRILYSLPFRRLAGVTQVVSPGEGEIYHNRLTHTLKVAQIARRIAEYFLNDPADKKAIESWGGLDPDVVEAAALAHDLGHPPFGHLAEEELNERVEKTVDTEGGNPDGGYEGNAQSFRILTKLAVRDQIPGLDLTAATLNAVLKYPWLNDLKRTKQKFNAYNSEEPEFRFARELQANLHGSERFQSLESQIMDWADDITYCVHDTEDFIRAGLIPFHRFSESTAEREQFLDAAIARKESINKPFKESRPVMKGYFDNFCSWFFLRERYRGSRSQRAALYRVISDLINYFILGTKLIDFPGKAGSALDRPEAHLAQVALLKELTWHYVIDNPGLATQQFGQRKAIGALFEVFDKAAKQGDWKLFPPLFQEDVIELSRKGEIPPTQRARLVADTISSMTDQQTIKMYHRLQGISPGSSLDPVVL